MVEMNANNVVVIISFVVSIYVLARGVINIRQARKNENEVLRLEREYCRIKAIRENEILIIENQLKESKLERAVADINRLRNFISDIGCNPDAVMSGLWLHNAAKIIDVQVAENEAERRLRDNGHTHDDTIKQILMAARAIVPGSRQEACAVGPDFPPRGTPA